MGVFFLLYYLRCLYLLPYDIHRVAKRITVIFRGSVTARDWLTNLTVRPKKLKIPASLEGVDLGFDADKDPIAVHSGFDGKPLSYSTRRCPCTQANEKLSRVLGPKSGSPRGTIENGSTKLPRI